MNASQREEEGHRLMAEAEKQASSIKSGGFFRSLFSSSGATAEDAAETYVRAAQSFKLAKAWLLSGKAYEAASATYSSVADMQYEAASKLTDAAKAYKNGHPTQSISAYERAITLYADSGRFQQCARHQKDLSELYESQLSSDDSEALQKVIASYNQCADYYDMDDATSNANTARVKVASLSALAKDYPRAIEVFESVAQAALSSGLLKYGAREHLLKAGLCKLCLGDVVAAERAVDAYASMDPSFASSREGRLLADVVKAVSDGDEPQFTSTVFEFDSISKLDEWKTTILLRIKNQIKAADTGEEDLT